MNRILVYYTSEHAELMHPKYKGDAGMDVVCTETTTIVPGQVKEIPLGMMVALPSEIVYEGSPCGVVLFPDPAFTFITRSSAIAKGIFVLPTLIDNGYRGPLYLFAMNVSERMVCIEAGTRIAQMVLLSNLAGQMAVVEVAEEGMLTPSERGNRGFGSSGGGA